MASETYNRSIMDWGAFPACDLIWTDPPWGDRMSRFFLTMMKKQTGLDSPYHPADELVAKLATLADKSKPLFIEYSVKGSDDIAKMVSFAGHRLAWSTVAPQENGKPFAILAFNLEAFPTIKPPTGKGFSLIKEILAQFPPGSTVFDPFAGIGQTASAVISSGHNYIGSELNPSRYARLKEVVGR